MPLVFISALVARWSADSANLAVFVSLERIITGSTGCRAKSALHQDTEPHTQQTHFAQQRVSSDWRLEKKVKILHPGYCYCYCEQLTRVQVLTSQQKSIRTSKGQTSLWQQRNRTSSHKTFKEGFEPDNPAAPHPIGCVCDAPAKIRKREKKKKKRRRTGWRI